MTFVSFAYATTRDCRDRASAHALADAIADRLTDIQARLPGLGWQVIALVEAVDFDDFDVDPQTIARVTGGRLPAVNVNLSFNRDIGPVGDPEIDDLLVQYGLVLATR